MDDLGGDDGPAIVVTPAPPPARPVGPSSNNADDHRRGYARARCRPADLHTPGTDRHLSDTPDSSAGDEARRPTVSTRAPRRVRLCDDAALTDPPSASADGQRRRPSVRPARRGVRSGAQGHPATAATLFVPSPPCTRPPGRDSAPDHAARGARRTMGDAAASRPSTGPRRRTSVYRRCASTRRRRPSGTRRAAAVSTATCARGSGRRVGSCVSRWHPAPHGTDRPPAARHSLGDMSAAKPCRPHWRPSRAGLPGGRAMQASLAGGLSGCHHTGDTDRPSGGRSVRRTESHRP